MNIIKVSGAIVILVMISLAAICTCTSQAQNDDHDGGDQERRQHQGNMSAPREDASKNPSHNQPEKPDQLNQLEKPDEEKPHEKTDEEKPPDRKGRLICDDCRKCCRDCDGGDDCELWWQNLASWMSLASWMNSDSWSMSGQWDVSYYSGQIAEAPGILVDESESYQYSMAVSSTVVEGQNVLRVASIDGSRNWGSMEMPLYYYARLLIIPSTSGELNLEEMGPDGEIRYYNLGYVSAVHQYRFWKYSDSEGSHLLRYRIDDSYDYSDTIRIYVT